MPIDERQDALPPPSPDEINIAITIRFAASRARPVFRPIRPLAPRPRHRLLVSLSLHRQGPILRI